MPSRAWEEISIDFIIDLPPRLLDSIIFDTVLIIVNRYTKINLYMPTTKRCTSVELTSLLERNVVRYYGLPKGIVSNRGSIFTS